jgi:hypothetical protein
MSEENQGPTENPEGPLTPVLKPEQTAETPPPGRTVGGAHDLSDHPALAGGTIVNPGDTVLNRDPNEPSFRRPQLQDPEEVQAEQSEGERSTTTESPAKKGSRGKSKGEGAGPES